MSELSNTKHIADVENTIREQNESVIGQTRLNLHSNEFSTKEKLTLSTGTEKVQKAKPKVLKTFKKKGVSKKPKTVSVDNTSAQKISKQTESVKKPDTKKKLNEKVLTSVAKKLEAKVAVTSKVQGTVNKLKTLESDKKSPMKKPLPVVQPLSKPKPKIIKRTKPVQQNLITGSENLEEKKEKPKRILKPVLKSDGKKKTPKQSDDAKPSDNSKR